MHTGVYGHLRRVCPEIWLREKNPLPYREIEPFCQRRAGPTLYKLSYILTRRSLTRCNRTVMSLFTGRRLEKDNVKWTGRVTFCKTDFLAADEGWKAISLSPLGLKTRTADKCDMILASEWSEMMNVVNSKGTLNSSNLYVFFPADLSLSLYLFHSLTLSLTLSLSHSLSHSLSLSLSLSFALSLSLSLSLSLRSWCNPLWLTGLKALTN